MQAPPAEVDVQMRDARSEQMGGTRSLKHVRSSGHPHNTAPANAAFEGGLHSRVSEDRGRQGISSRSSAEESEGQRKVVSTRPDARAGLDHSSGHPH